MKLALAAVVAIALLGAAQVIAPRKTYSVTKVSAPPTQEIGALNLQADQSPRNLSVTGSNTGPTAIVAAVSNAVQIGFARSNSPTAATGTFTYAGRVMLDLAKVPLWGKSEAPNKLISLYDYTCHHCRDMHPHVANLRRVFGDQLAIISLPMPLDAQCNPLVRRTPRAHENSCSYARLGLIVWHARHDAIEQFDDWLFSFPTPPPLTAVTNKAVDLVGLMAFEAAKNDPWVEQQLQTDIAIYTINGNEFKQGNMPQFMMGSDLVSGTMTGEQLQAFVAAHVQPKTQ